MSRANSTASTMAAAILTCLVLPLSFVATVDADADAEAAWRQVCQFQCGEYNCKIGDRDVLSLKYEEMPLDDGIILKDMYGRRHTPSIYRTRFEGQVLDYALDEVSNCVYVVWSNSPLFND